MFLGAGFPPSPSWSEAGKSAKAGNPLPSTGEWETVGRLEGDPIVQVRLFCGKIT